jgi:hypothetical protein
VISKVFVVTHHVYVSEADTQHFDTLFPKHSQVPRNGNLATVSWVVEWIGCRGCSIGNPTVIIDLEGFHKSEVGRRYANVVRLRRVGIIEIDFLQGDSEQLCSDAMRRDLQDDIQALARLYGLKLIILESNRTLLLANPYDRIAGHRWSVCRTNQISFNKRKDVKPAAPGSDPTSLRSADNFTHAGLESRFWTEQETVAELDL